MMEKRNPTSGWKKQALALAITAAIPSAGLMAEEVRQLPTSKASAEAEEGYKVDKSSSVKLTQPIAKTPKTIDVVSGETLQDQGVTSLTDALRNVSGVSTFGGGEGGGGVVSANDKVTIRGFDARSSIYVDGIRDVAGYNRDLFNYEQVEVTKGASGSLDGRNTGGGSVNLVTKRAKLDDFGSVGASYDTADTKRVTLDGNKQLSDDTAARINLLYSNGGDALDNGVENYKTVAGAASVLFQASEQTSMTLDAMVMKQDNVPVLGLPFIKETNAASTGMAEGPIDSSRWDEYFGVKGRDYEKVNTKMLTFTVNHDVNDFISVRSQTRFGKNDKESVLSRPWWGSLTGDNDEYDDTGLMRLDISQNLDQSNKLFVSQLDTTIALGSDDFTQDIVIGAEYAREDRTNYGVTGDFTYTGGIASSNPERTDVLFDPTVTNGADSIRATGGLVRNGNDTIGKSTTLSLYAFDTLKFGEQFQVDLNLRFDKFKIEGDSCGRGGCTENVDASANTFSYGAAFSWLPTDNGNIYLGYANAQQPPGTDLALSNNVGRNALDPEESKTLELGTKWELLDERLMLSAAIFKTTKTVTDSEGRGTSAQYYLTGEQESSGFELSAVGQLSDSVSLTTSYTSLDTEVTEDRTAEAEGLGLQGSPDDTASLWLSYTGMDDRLTLGAGGNYNSGETFWRRNTAYYTVDAYTVWSAMAAYQATDALKLQVNIDNLTDEEYVTDYSAKGHFKPGNPRSIKGSLTYNF